MSEQQVENGKESEELNEAHARDVKGEGNDVVLSSNKSLETMRVNNNKGSKLNRGLIENNEMGGATQTSTSHT